MAKASGADERAAGDTTATLPRVRAAHPPTDPTVATSAPLDAASYAVAGLVVGSGPVATSTPAGTAVAPVAVSTATVATAAVATAATLVTDHLHALASDDGDGDRPGMAVEDPTMPAAARALRRSMHHLDQLVEALTATDALVAAAMATRVRLLDRARRWSEHHAHLLVAATEHGPAGGAVADQGLARRAVVAELACALRVPERTMDETLVQAEVLVDELPATMAALDAGTIAYPHALVMVDETVGLDAAQVPTLERQALPAAQTSTVATFRRRARRIRDRLAPGSLTERRRRASAQRCVDLLPGRDGMATLSHYLPAVQAHAIDHRLTDIARHLQSPTENRTLTQLRADVLTSLLLDDQGQAVPTSAFGAQPVPVPVPVPARTQVPVPVHPGAQRPHDVADRLPDTEPPTDTSTPDEPRPAITAEPPSTPTPTDRGTDRGTEEPNGLHPPLGPEPPDEDFPPEGPTRSTWSPTDDASGRETTEEPWTVPHSLRGIRPTVIVTVPVMTLLGHSDEPGYLHGHGPIDPETARHLAAQAPSFLRLLTHPETGTVLSVGRDRYAVPADLRTWVRLRDETCRFPGCARRAEACDLDHTIAWQDGGTTSCDNLAALCPAHHHLKHDTTWGLSQGPGGVLTFTSPTGRRYTTEPALAIAPAAARPGAAAPGRTGPDIRPAGPGHSRTSPRQHRHHAAVPA